MRQRVISFDLAWRPWLPIEQCDAVWFGQVKRYIVGAVKMRLTNKQNSILTETCFTETWVFTVRDPDNYHRRYVPGAGWLWTVESAVNKAFRSLAAEDTITCADHRPTITGAVWTAAAQANQQTRRAVATAFSLIKWPPDERLFRHNMHVVEVEQVVAMWRSVIEPLLLGGS